MESSTARGLATWALVNTSPSADKITPEPMLEAYLAHVDPHDGVEETIKTSAHCGLRRRGEHQRQAEGKGEG
jgi:hypothetical protein